MAALAARLVLTEAPVVVARPQEAVPRGVGAPLLCFAIKSLVFIGLTTLVPFVLQQRLHLSVRETALVFMGIAIGVGLTQGVLVPQLAKLLEERAGTVLGFACLTVGAASGALLVWGTWFVWMSIAALTLGYSILTPFQLADLSRRFGPQRAGYGMGLAVVAASGGATIGPVLTGALASGGGFALAFGVAALLSAIATALSRRQPA